MSTSTPPGDKPTGPDRSRLDHELVGAARAALGVLLDAPARWHTARTVELETVGYPHATLRRALGVLAAADVLQTRHAADRATGYRPAGPVLDDAPECPECHCLVIAVDHGGDEPAGWPCGHQVAGARGSYSGGLGEVFARI